MAQFSETGAFFGNPVFQNKPLQVPSFHYSEAESGDLLIDNFEYWDSPYNHGWKTFEPSYPFYGLGLGYPARVNTLLDLQEGSRVLDFYYRTSIFLLGQQYEKSMLFYNLCTPPGIENNSLITYIDLTERPFLSFNFRAPIGIEPWDIFEFDVVCTNNKNYTITLKIAPIQHIFLTALGSEATPIITEFNDSLNQPSMTIQMDIGRTYMDGTWHVIWLNLPDIVKTTVHAYEKISEAHKADWYVTRAEKIMIRGQMFRLDNITFRTRDYSRYSSDINIDVFEFGPLYAQIFEPFRYLFMADYKVDQKISNVNDFLLDQNNFICDPNQIKNTWIHDLLAIDPNYHTIDSSHPLYDPHYSDRWVPGDNNFGEPDPVASVYIRDNFFIDLTLPLFADPDLRIGGSKVTGLRKHGTLGWNTAIGGFGQNAIEAFLVKPLPIDPYDGMPTYIMSRYAALKAIDIFGKAHFGPSQSLLLESALWNAGMELWPHIAYFDYTPQYFEDLIVTMEITNQNKVEKHVFPLSVVNYSVENYPPVTQSRILPSIFKVGEENNCTLISLDPDCFIFSMAQFQGKIPSSTHLPMLPNNKIRTDQDTLTYKMYIEGVHSYQYGPWIECGYDPSSGVAKLTPKFECVLKTITICSDIYGAYDFGSKNIYCVNPGTWYNHPPVITLLPNPRVIRAGEEIIFNVKASDPDGDELYASCNIGSLGQIANGDTIWTFQTNLPGIYTLEIIFYDIRGGYAIGDVSVEVCPWWSY